MPTTAVALFVATLIVGTVVSGGSCAAAALRHPSIAHRGGNGTRDVLRLQWGGASAPPALRSRAHGNARRGRRGGSPAPLSLE